MLVGDLLVVDGWLVFWDARSVFGAWLDVLLLSDCRVDLGFVIWLYTCIWGLVVVAVVLSNICCVVIFADNIMPTNDKWAQLRRSWSCLIFAVCSCCRFWLGSCCGVSNFVVVFCWW